jgi:conjugal transfer/entry exclusion protein
MLEYYRDYEKATITNDTHGKLQDEHNSLRGTKLITEQIIKNINDRSNYF